MNRQSGFTILELLVAAAIMAILLTSLAGMLGSTTRAYQAEDRASSERQVRESAQQQLKYEIALAGYRGTLKSDYDNTATSVGAAPFVITPNTTGGSDQVTIKYFENRAYGSGTKEAKTVTFSVNTQTNTLVRTQGSSVEPIAAGIRKLKVVRYLLKGATGSESDCVSACAATPSSNTVGVILALTFMDNSVQRIPINFQNPIT